ncbi:hypothetical protein K1T71_011673 [Dendrolimus kikuchii]|uniref:Uncharacterized protein n=1 Tax=Dendrolimus kikuchii TaxID=765133 RepID=A0ACC1CLQ6_9NEOP|nr:hypothetical protein K1T71_011673 [Dendrolimus kikuchii]
MWFDFRNYVSDDKIEPADDGSLGTQIDLHIGNDYYCLFIEDKIIHIKENLYIIDTEFEWVCSGQLKSSTECILSTTTYLQTHLAKEIGFTTPDPSIRDGEIKELWELETIGIKDSPKGSIEETALQHFHDTIEFKMDTNEKLSSNFGLAIGRLQSLLKRTSMNILEEYNKILNEQENLGIIEKVKDYRITPNHPIHYLPHHHVVKQDNTTKLIIVYDASAKLNKDHYSLNELLYKGPKLLEDLVGILLSFRQNEIAVVADVEKAFLQLGLQDEDKDVTRFLWLNNIKQSFIQENIICYRFCRVSFGVISSPFLLNATIKFHLQKYQNEVLSRVAKNIYVDNLVISVRTPEDAYYTYIETKKAFDNISMNIRQWNSNSLSFIQKVNEDQRERKRVTNVLGMTWDTKDDSLKFKINIENFENSKHNPTKRKILSAVASIFDPCGFAAPELLQAKIYIQDLWKAKYKWDTILPKEMVDKWMLILNNLEKLRNFQIPRYTRFKNCKLSAKYELHCFSDASLQSYAAVIYLKTIYLNNIKLFFLMGKTRLISPKDQNDLKIPRLELLGCLIGTTLITYVQNNLELCITKAFIWTSSQIVINWIKTNKLLHPFVSRRVEEINKHKDIEVLSP